MHRTRFALATALALVVPALPLHAQSASPPPGRAVHRDMPLTDVIRRAFAAGTRDSTGTPGPGYWQLRVDYDIDARLDPSPGVVTGQETVVLHNRSPHALESIVLRLDQNVFRPDAVRSRSVNDVTDGMEVTRLVVDGEAVDLAWAPPRRRRGEPPPEGPLPTFVTGLTTTSARVVLDEPVPAGGSTTLEVDWSFRVPRAEDGRGLRMGAWGDSLFQVAQWYPKVAVYDDLRGWDAEPYLGSSEFYHNFGSFDVSLDVPAGWTVGATGVLQNPSEVLPPRIRERLARVPESDETRTIVAPEDFGPGGATLDGDRLVWRFVADTVNDFAWATSDRYVWEATRVAIPGGGAIPFHWMYLPGNAGRFQGADAIGRHALRFYSELWTPYAFPQLTMVDGPDTGMEYPMLIMSATGAEDHEIGHEWWPMMVGTNETWYGFMDEGFNQYMNLLSRAARQGVAPDLDGLGQRYGRTSGDEREAPLMWNANYGGPMYSFQAYSKAPLMLSMLGGIVGDTAVWTAIGGYAEAWLFKHPSPWDFAFFMNHALERDLDWFWYSWLFTTDAVDGSIEDVRTADGVTTVTVRQDGGMPSPVVLEVRLAAEGPPVRPMPGSRMVDERTVVVSYPVDVWFDGRRSFAAELDFGGRGIEAVVLDPHGRFPDAVVEDNVWPREVAASAGGEGG